jgi:hypothetical protein
MTGVDQITRHTSHIGGNSSTKGVAFVFDPSDTRGDISYNGGNSVYTGASNSFNAGDIIGVALDLDNNNVKFYKNGVLQYNLSNILQSGASYTFGVSLYSGGTISGNFGQRAWAYAPPQGYNALTTKNLPKPAVGSPAAEPNQFFDAVTYTGNGTTQNISSLNFQPDFVWLKIRSTSDSHGLFDSVRGAGKRLQSNDTGIEATRNDVLTSFTSSGFSITGNDTQSNANGSTYVAWCWRAGGAAVSNTAGTIASQVSANTASGFSIVSYTANGVTGATVGHGLTTAPTMVIFKIRGSSGFNWFTYHSGLTSPAHYLYLNSTNAEANTFNYINNTAPSSSVLTLGAIADTNSNGSNYVAYCWTEVPGFSKIGSFTANGSTDGPFVYTGFKPRWIMIKAISSTSQWVLIDTARDTFNSSSSRSIFANSNSAEETGNASEAFDIVSNGFKLRSNGRVNVNGVTHIYMAFAEKPFGNVNGTAR